MKCRLDLLLVRQHSMLLIFSLLQNFIVYLPLYLTKQSTRKACHVRSSQASRSIYARITLSGALMILKHTLVASSFISMQALCANSVICAMICDIRPILLLFVRVLWSSIVAPFKNLCEFAIKFSLCLLFMSRFIWFVNMI